jgi:C4-dicarboxylate-specific signal transduction histidine kinase/putative methionine-R-sulfoxide reductase with GAF domain
MRRGNGNRRTKAQLLEEIQELRGRLEERTIETKQMAAEALRKAKDELETRVRERTAELEHANQALQEEIAEHRRAEEAVKAERQRLNDLLEILPAYLILLSPDYHVPFANRFFRERFGESQGKRCFEYLFGRTEPCEICETYTVLKTNAPHHWEWTGPDGRNYDIFDFPFIDTDGSTLIMEMGIDITERKQAEAALQKAHDLLEVRVKERTAELAESNAQLHKLNRVLNALSNSNQALMRAENESDYLDEVCQIIVQDCGHEMVWIGFAEEDEGKTVQPVACAGFEEGYLKTLNVTWADTERGRGPTGTAIRTGKPCKCANMLTDPKFVPWREQAIKRGYASSIVFPLLDGGKAFGAINIYSRQPDAFSEDEARLLSELADDLAYGITAIRLREAHQRTEEALRRGAERFKLLSEVTAQLLVSNNPRAIVERLCREVMEHLGCDCFFNFLADEASARLRLNACAGIPPEEARKIEWLDYGVGVCGCVAQQGCRIVAEDIQHADDPRTELVKSYGIQAYACHPLLGQGRVIGTLSFGARSRTTFTGDELALMKTVADQVAVAMQRIQSQQALRRAHDELEQRVAERTLELLQVNEELTEKIEEHARLLEALRKSQARLAEAQRIAHLGGWDWNVVTDELSWSDEMFRIFGFAPQSFAVNYSRFLERVHPDDRANVNDRVERALQGLERYDVTYRIVLPDNTLRVVHAQGEIEFNEAGVPVRMIGTVLDITEQVRAQEEAAIRQQQLVQADKMVSIGILASGIAHEINNPNHSIMSNVSSLAAVWHSVQPILDRFSEDFGDFVLGGFDYFESRDKLPRMFANALANSKRIELIVTELRDFARYSPSEKMTAVDVNAVVKSAVILVTNMVQKHTDQFTVDYGTDLPAVIGNSQRIEQVVINLIHNACQSLPNRAKGVHVRTSFSAQSQTVQIEVHDEGVGIPEEDLRHLGDPFFTSKRAIGGMGLGLWISFNIAHEHGGTLTFSSKLGEGASAVLAIPSADPPDGRNNLEVKREDNGQAGVSFPS